MRFPLTLVPILLAGQVAAAEDDFWLREDLPFIDIRFGVASVPIPDQYPVTVDIYPAYGGGTVTYADDMDEDQATSFSYTIIGGILDPVGPLYGFELVHTFATQNLVARTENGVTTPAGPDPSSLQYRTLGGNLLYGLGIQLSPNVHLEALGVAGAGCVDLEFADYPGVEQADGGGHYWTIGARVGAYVTYRRLVLGICADYSTLQLDAHEDWIDASTSTETDVTGFSARFEIGYHIK